MLSNPPTSSNIHSRQRLHRRQNSTPTAFEAVKIAPLPNFRQQQHQQQHQQQQQRSHVSHRRGMSLDTRRLHLQQLQPTSSPTRQDFSVSTTTTNQPGLSTTTQHILRETQQQRTLARPGPSQLNNNNNNNQHSNHNTPTHSRHNSISSVSSIHTRGHSRNSSINHFGIDENSFLLSPHGTPQSQRFMDPMSSHGQIDDMGIPFDPYMSAMNLMMKKNQASYDAAPAQDFELYAPDSALSTPTFMTFAEASPGSHQGWMSEGEAANSRRSSRRISNGIMDRVAKFENIASLDADEPATPPEQNDNRYFPPTPMQTPHDRVMKHTQRQSRPNRFAEDYDESMEETLKPVRGNRTDNRNSGVFAELRRQAEAMQSTQNQNTMSMPYADAPLSTTEFLNLTNMEAAAFIKIEEDNFHGLPSGTLNISPDRSQGTSPMPMHPNLANFSMLNAYDTKHDFNSQETLHGRTTSNHSSRYGSPNHHHHRRTESLASVVSAASIASINIEETKTDTGVTMEEITLYIDGPDSTNGKWTCTFESCGKQFGRKENIKSHVQTHLNDRQYRCPTCKKCFVRQHDLKRHAKIHTGIKPYPCECGNSFARHDALTRHRQRGMCIGAFDGIVRKVVKRGRPRKITRPDMDERLEKSERTRRKIKAENATPSSGSSQSGYEDSSAGDSPENEFDGVLDDAPFNLSDMEMMDGGDMASAGLEMDLPDLKPARMTSPSGISTATMPSYESQEPVTSVSPEQITANSPSSMSTYSYHALPTLSRPTDKVDNPSSPTKSVTSNYTHQPGTPPELSASSSPPCEPPHTANDEPRYFDDFDPNESGLSDHSIGLGTTAAAHAAGLELVDVDDEGVWGINEDGLVQMMGAGSGGNAKYFEDAEDAVALFTNGDDVFFGSS